MSTRRKPPTRRPTGVRSTGIKVQARHRHHQPLPEPPTGEHVWAVLGAWRIHDPAAAVSATGEIHLDLENLLTLEGPACIQCEQPYSPELATHPCHGDPTTPTTGRTPQQ